MNDLLDLSRLDVDALEPKLGPLDLCTVLAEAVSTVEPAALETNTTITTRCTEHPIPCHTDGKRVKQIVINLLRNATRHGAGKGVTLEVRTDDNRITIAVADQGEGISPTEQAIIFDAYKRAESRAGGGTGLGLTLCARLARLLGGDISVKSELGAGATFTFHIARHLEAR